MLDVGRIKGHYILYHLDSCKQSVSVPSFTVKDSFSIFRLRWRQSDHNRWFQLLIVVTAGDGPKTTYL